MGREGNAVLLVAADGCWELLFENRKDSSLRMSSACQSFDTLYVSQQFAFSCGNSILQTLQ